LKLGVSIDVIVANVLIENKPSALGFKNNVAKRTSVENNRVGVSSQAINGYIIKNCSYSEE
jgi:hypothetical protein